MSLIERTVTISFQHRVYFTKNVFGLANPLLREVLAAQGGQVPKAFVVLDETLHLAQPALAPQIETYFRNASAAAQLVCPPLILEGGERVKNSYFHVSEIQSQVDRYHIDRHSYLVAVGGGALLDLVGLAEEGNAIVVQEGSRGMQRLIVNNESIVSLDFGLVVVLRPWKRVGQKTDGLTRSSRHQCPRRRREG